MERRLRETVVADRGVFAGGAWRGPRPVLGSGVPAVDGIRAGVGGWTYAPWRHSFYPEGLVARRELEVKRENLEERSQQELSLDLKGEYPEYRAVMTPGDVARIDVPEAQKEIDALKDAIKKLGNVNLDALNEEQTLEQQNDTLIKQVADIEQARDQLVQLITELGEHHTEDVRIALEAFLQDASEPVRFATTMSLFSIGDAASVPAFIAALETEESLRIRNRIAQGIAERGWELPAELVETAKKALPSGFRVEGLRLRGEPAAH